LWIKFKYRVGQQVVTITDILENSMSGAELTKRIL